MATTTTRGGGRGTLRLIQQTDGDLGSSYQEYLKGDRQRPGAPLIRPTQQQPSPQRNLQPTGTRVDLRTLPHFDPVAHRVMKSQRTRPPPPGRPINVARNPPPPPRAGGAQMPPTTPSQPVQPVAYGPLAGI